MRIIGGRFKRAALKAPKGEGARPTTDRVREALFNLLGARVRFEGAAVLDLFAGTGALGLEALSRGAASAVFVERDGRTLALARQNADALGIADACRFVRADALVHLKRASGSHYDLILADPPYGLDALAELPGLALPLLTEGGVFVLEHDARHDFAQHPALMTSRTYGRTVLSLFGEENPSAG